MPNEPVKTQTIKKREISSNIGLNNIPGFDMLSLTTRTTCIVTRVQRPINAK